MLLILVFDTATHKISATVLRLAKYVDDKILVSKLQNLKVDMSNDSGFSRVFSRLYIETSIKI